MSQQVMCFQWAFCVGKSKIGVGVRTKGYRWGPETWNQGPGTKDQGPGTKD